MPRRPRLVSILASVLFAPGFLTAVILNAVSGCGDGLVLEAPELSGDAEVEPPCELDAALGGDVAIRCAALERDATSVATGRATNRPVSGETSLDDGTPGRGGGADTAAAGAGPVAARTELPSAAEDEPPFLAIDGLPPSERPRRVRRLESRALRGALRRATRAANRRIARGPSETERFRRVAFRLGAGPLETQLAAAADAYLTPSPSDFVYYADAAGEAATVESFEIHPSPTAADVAAAERVLADLAALVERHPHLRVLRLQAGWADAVGGAYHGVAIVDPATGEALWVFAVATWTV